ncbi:hypothetical protein [Kribbella deserti]|uniref:Uncharacterized protein n=1 Tax=Kribbella deserti TaxID=1926257 RepID=A0ABV6QDX8_9ACTN
MNPELVMLFGRYDDLQREYADLAELEEDAAASGLNLNAKVDERRADLNETSTDLLDHLAAALREGEGVTWA